MILIVTIIIHPFDWKKGNDIMFIYIQYSILNQYMIDVHSLKVNLVIGIGIIKIGMMFISAELQKCTHFKSNYLAYYFLAGWIFLFSLDIGRFARECTCQDVIALNKVFLCQLFYFTYKTISTN